MYIVLSFSTHTVVPAVRDVIALCYLPVVEMYLFRW